MNSNKIKSMMIERGIKQTEIAKRLKISRSAVCSVLSGASTSRRVKECVIALVGEECRKYWKNQPDKARI